MSRWFRFYDDALNNRKAQSLPGDLFKLWVNILCIASKHGGVLPSLADVAFGLRLTEQKAAVIVGSLAKRELLDAVEGGYFRPHDWDTRQYKTDVTDPTNAERQKRYRDSKRVTGKTVTPPVTPTVTDKRPETEAETEAETEIGGGGDAREPVAKAPWELEPSHDLARQLAEIAKASDEFEGTGWGGATYRVKTWLSEGWKAEFILAAFRETCGKSGYLPPNGIKYFEKIVARFIALQRQPLPAVVEIPAKTVEVSHGSTNNSASAAARRLEQSIQQQLAESGLDNEPYQPTYLRIQAG